MVYICPGGNCTGIAIFFLTKCHIWNTLVYINGELLVSLGLKRGWKWLLKDGPKWLRMGQKRLKKRAQNVVYRRKTWYVYINGELLVSLGLKRGWKWLLKDGPKWLRIGQKRLRIKRAQSVVYRRKTWYAYINGELLVSLGRMLFRLAERGQPPSRDVR